jgi:hypothetical protein
MIHPLLPERHDVLTDGRAPKHLRKWLRDVGGVNPWGENRYRLVIAEKVMVYVGARWHDWKPNTVLQDQGGLEFSGTRKSKNVMRDPSDHSKTIEVEMDVPAMVGVSQNSPIRVVEEMRWIPRYSDIKGWLLQVWYPPNYYAREHYEVHVEGRPDLPLLGEFPAHGVYERQFTHDEQRLDGSWHLAETFPTIPGQSWMELAIQHNERAITERGDVSVSDTERAWRSLKHVAELQAARVAHERREQANAEAMLKDDISPVFGSSLESGRIREELAAKCRMKGIVLGHVGN